MMHSKFLTVALAMLLLTGAVCVWAEEEISPTQPAPAVSVEKEENQEPDPEEGAAAAPVPSEDEVVQVASRGKEPWVEASQLVKLQEEAAMAVPHRIVAASAREALVAIERHKGTFQENPSVLTQELTDILEPVVAFEAIAKAVMGKYYRQATAGQRKRFVKTFKERMSEFYTRILVTFEAERVVVLPPEGGKDISSSTQVMAEVITKDNTVYSVTYSMRKNKEGQWQARNVIVNGINLGLTYRNQFYGAMARYDGNIDRVISSWGPDVHEH
jgi:phospholipid transport system substrate-binding protein